MTTAQRLIFLAARRRVVWVDLVAWSLLAVVIAVLLLAGQASAAYVNTLYGNGVNLRSSPQAFCADFGGPAGEWVPQHTLTKTAPGGLDACPGVNGCCQTAVGCDRVNGNVCQFVSIASAAGACANGTISGGNCTCNGGFSQVTDAWGGFSCQTTGGCTLSIPNGSSPYYQFYSQNQSSATFCSGGFQQMFSANIVNGAPVKTSTIVNGRLVIAIQGVMGPACGGPLNNAPVPCAVSTPTPMPTSAPTVPAATCAAGQKTVTNANGGVSCYTPTSAGNGASVPVVSSGGSPDGSVLTSSTVTCPTGIGGTCSQVTVQNQDGTISTTTFSSLQPGAPLLTNVSPNPLGNTAGDTFCRQNPSAPGCKSGGTDFCTDHPTATQCLTSSWSAACGSTPTCGGDAVQCAQAVAAQELYCDLTKTGAQSDLGIAVTGGADPMAGSLPNKTAPENIDLAGSISTGTFWAGSCPGDETVSVGSHSFVIPWSRACSVFQMLGWCLVALTGLSCARIVGVWG